MKLAIFDIDGTLTDTNKVDEDCFRRTFDRLWKIQDLSTDWAAYRTSTDSGILDEIFQSKLGRSPQLDEIEKHKSILKEELERSHSEMPTLFSGIGGTESLFESFSKAGWKIAIATGAWEISAHFKLSRAKIDFSKIPMATADDDFDRARIIDRAWKRAEVAYAISNFQRVLYIGDGVWDLKSSRELGVGFLGIDCQGSAERLKNVGVQKFIHHYRDIESVLKLAEDCAAFVNYPKSEAS